MAVFFSSINHVPNINPKHVKIYVNINELKQQLTSIVMCIYICYKYSQFQQHNTLEVLLKIIYKKYIFPVCFKFLTQITLNSIILTWFYKLHTD